MTKSKITKEIARLYAENIAHKYLPMPYQRGMKLFKADVVNFISSNFYVMGRKKFEQEVQNIFNANLSREEEKKRIADLIFSLP